MAKIVIDARESGTSSGRYTDKLVEYLALLKPSHQVIVLSKPQRLEFLCKLAPGFKVVLSPYKEFTFAEQLGLLRQLRKLQPDLVHFPMVQQPILYRGKVVTTMNDLTTVRFKNPSKNRLLFFIKQTIYRYVNKIVAHKSAALLTFTEYVKDDVARFARVNSRKITAIYLAADKITDEPEPVEGLEDSQFIMYIGRPQMHKNLGRLIEAFAVLKQTHPNLKLVLAGKKDGLYERHEKFVHKHGIADVVFTGFVSEGQLRWLYEHTAAYIFPSLSEGFGLPGLEAMIHGAPVVSSNTTCLPEVYGDAAVYFDPTNIEDMAIQIGRVLKNDTLQKELISKGKKQAASYSWERMAQQTLAVYEEVLGS